MLQLEKYIRIQNQLRDILSANQLLKQDERLFLDEIVNNLTTIADMESSEAFLCDQVREMITKLRTKINRVLSLDWDESLYRIFCKLLVLMTKDIPLNLRAPHNQGWTCPLTLEPLYFYYLDRAHQSIALTSGYLYDRFALMEWYKQHANNRDPVTKTPLKQLDIEKLEKSAARIKVLQKIDNEYTNLYNTYYSNQQNKFTKHNLSVSDQLKKDFISALSHKEFRYAVEQDSKTVYPTAYNLMEQIHKKIKEYGIKQQPESMMCEGNFNYCGIIFNHNYINFNNLNLSGLLIEEKNSSIASLSFRGANFSNSIFLHAHIYNCDFTDANLAGVRFISDRKHHYRYEFKYTNFTNADLQDVEFPYFYSWYEVNMAGANLSGAYIYNPKEGKKITGEELKRFLTKRGVDGLDTAIFSQNNNNNNNTTPTTQNNSNIPKEISASTSQQGFFSNTNDNSFKQEIDSLRQQNQQLQQQVQQNTCSNKIIHSHQEQIQSLKQQNQQLQRQLQQQSQQMQQQNTLLQQQNRLFSQHLQQLQPQQQQPEHHHRKHEHCIVM